MGTWQEELDRECWRVIDSGGGEVRIIFIPIQARTDNEFKYIIRRYPNNQVTGKFKVKNLD